VRYVVDVARYRHLAWNLVGSDLRARFRRTRLGILWAILQPLGFSLIIGTVWSQVFGAKSVSSFVVYVFSGMLVWEYINQCILVSLDSLLNSRGYLKQARIPFVIFQMRMPLSGLVILMFGLVGLVGLMLAVGAFPAPGLHLLLLPLYFLMLLIFAIPLSIISSLVGPAFRDARYVIMLALQAVFFLSPVMFDRAVLHSQSLWFLQYVNPVVPLLDLFRDPMLHGILWAKHDILSWAAWTGALWMIALWSAYRSGRGIVFAL
jgi:lipopolysaccharide transport system permease protein